MQYQQWMSSNHNKCISFLYIKYKMQCISIVYANEYSSWFLVYDGSSCVNDSSCTNSIFNAPHTSIVEIICGVTSHIDYTACHQLSVNAEFADIINVKCIENKD
eukprot:333131_1